jgi:hypothetical protein
MTPRNSLTKARNISKNFFFVKHNIVTEKSLQIKYLRYRILRPVLKTYYWIFKQLNPGTPWTSPASIRIFEQLLTKDMVGFEYGSGKSTVYFSHKLKELVSVEHDPNWFKRVEGLLSDRKVSNVQYKLFPAAKPADSELDDFISRHHLPDSFKPRNNYVAYFSYINEYPDNFFDFILIDGRARTECGLNALSKLKQHGMLVLDNSERGRYALLRERLKDWPEIHTTTGLTDTTLWFKP